MRESIETQREKHRPDWLPVFLGVTSTFAVMGALSIFGTAFRLLRLAPTDTVAELVIKLLWLIGSVAVSSYAGGFVTGFSISTHSRVAAALDGLLVTELTIIIYSAIAWFGYSPVPGLVYNQSQVLDSPESMLWWAMMISLPSLFTSIFGAMQGNDLAQRRPALGPNIELPTGREDPADESQPPSHERPAA
ncbi:MAG: hypothetical protein HY075_16240 [Deltaproteobacteria bacterium]|nr:hypothetical protein [Deltaproteobacteria bacterium]